MDATTKQRALWQFGLRWLFVAMLVVAAYATGRSHQNDELRGEIDQVRRELDMAKANGEKAIKEAGNGRKVQRGNGEEP